MAFDERKSQAMDAFVRSETPEDVADIRVVTERAFQGQQHTCGREAEIVDALRCAGSLAISLVIESAGRVIGHCAVSPVTVGSGEDGWFGLGPVSVDPKFQRCGYGSMLIRAALARLSEMGGRGCVLVGHPEYYVRFGFKADGSAIVAGAPAEVTFCLKLMDCRHPGEIIFHAAFGIHRNPD
ncbi:MAG: N-acetyltransferase [Verrucomicrobiales bacterium]|nr:N-acetyltransferase [Verrucomicrobiales bacterium]